MNTVVKQLSVGGFDSNFSYLVIDRTSGDAFVVDPCGDVNVIKSALEQFREISPRYILLTHGHGDHTSGVCELRRFFNAPTAGHKECSFKTDISLEDREVLDFGDIYIETIYSPGHTSDSVIYRMGDDSALFTGDTLFIDYCGYCTPETMYRTMRDIIFPLADSNEVYPGHDYGRAPHAPLGEEKRVNPYLASDTFESFKEILKDL